MLRCNTSSAVEAWQTEPSFEALEHPSPSIRRIRSQSAKSIRSQSPLPPGAPSASPTKAFLLRAHYVRTQTWPHHEAPRAFDLLIPQRSSSARYVEEDWRRLAQPRAGYSRDELTGPAKRVNAAVWKRNQFLRSHGYIDNPRQLLYLRFHGTSAEQARSQNSAMAAVQAATTPSREQQRQLLVQCWKMGRPVPDSAIPKGLPSTVDGKLAPSE